MIIFEEVGIRNFLSYGNAMETVKLDADGVHLILGDNRDVGENGSSRNGSGKTGWITSIVYALYGKGLQKISTDGYINVKNKKNMEVVLKFSKDGKKYVIERGRKPNKLILTEDGVDISNDSMRNTEAQIEQIVGMSFDVFVLLYFLSPSKPTFMGMSGAEQRDIIEKLLGLDTLTTRAETLKNITKEYKTELLLAEKDLEHILRNIDDATARLSDLDRKSREFEENKSNKINHLKSDLSNVEHVDQGHAVALIEVIAEKKTKLSELNGEISSTNSEINQLNSDERATRSMLDSEKSRLESYDASVAKIQEDIEKYHNEINELREIAHEDAYDELAEVLENDNKIINQIKDLQRAHDSKSSDLHRISSQIETNDDQLDKALEGKCYACGQDLHDDDTISKLKDEIEKQTKLWEGIQSNRLKISEEIEELRATLVNISRDDVNAARDIRDSINELKNKIKVSEGTVIQEPDLDKIKDLEEMLIEINELRTGLEEKLNTLIQEKDKTTERLQKLEAETKFKTRTELDMYFDKIERMENDLVAAEAMVNEFEALKDSIVVADSTEQQDIVDNLKRKINHAEYLVKLLTSNKSFIRKNIIDTYIPFVNKKIHEHTTTLGLPHVATLNNDMSVNINYMNSDLSYYNLSAGERLRLDTATSVAFRALVTTLGGGSNIMIVDELFDGALDEGGMYAAFNLLRNECPNIFMVSHRDEFKTLVTDTIIVTKENGFSSIRMDG